MTALRVYSAATSPTVNHDEMDSAGIGEVFYEGDRWHNVTAQQWYTCEDNAQGAAEWVITSGDDMEGSYVLGRAVTDTFLVSPDGDGTNGTTWEKAYTTVQSALDAASTDANAHTLILLAPGTYDVNTTGDPTWSGNYTIKSSHRVWSKIKNDHASATSVLKFTGRVSLEDIEIDCGTGDNNGVIVTGTGTKGFRCRHVYFEAEHVTAPHTCLEISGSTEYMLMEDVMFHGKANHTTGMILTNAKLGNFARLDFHECFVGIQFTGTSPDNIFSFILFHECKLGLDIDSGDTQFFHEISFRGCARNVDDEVKNHAWENIHGHFPIYIYPDNFTGVTVASAVAADTWGALTTVVAANAIDNPFRVVGTHFRPAVSQESRVRFTGTGGPTYYDDIFFDGNKRENAAAPSGTEFIFNADTEIEAAAKVIGGGPDNIVVWVEIQEI